MAQTTMYALMLLTVQELLTETNSYLPLFIKQVHYLIMMEIHIEQLKLGINGGWQMTWQPPSIITIHQYQILFSTQTGLQKMERPGIMVDTAGLILSLIHI